MSNPICPNKNHADWKELRKELDEDGAYLAYFRHSDAGGRGIPTIDEARNYLTKPEKVSEAVKTQMSKIAGGASDILKSMQKILNPRGISKEAGRMGDMLSDITGHSKKNMEALEAHYRVLQDKVSRPLSLDHDAVVRAQSRYVRGEAQVDEAGVSAKDIQSFFDFMADDYDQLIGRYADAGVQVQARLNYMEGMWKDQKKATSLMTENMNKSIGGNSNFLKQKKYNDWSEAVAAGLEPKSWDMAENILLGRANNEKFIAKKLAFQEMKAKGTLKFVAEGYSPEEGWSGVKSSDGVVYGPDFVKAKEYVDKAVWDGLLKTNQNIGAKTGRVVNAGRGRLGFNQMVDGGYSVSQRATELGVMAHETGHAIDQKYGLLDKIMGEGKGSKKEINGELKALADIVSEGRKPSGKTHSNAEKVAHIVEAYVHAPSVMQKVAPKVYESFKSFVDKTPELEPLRSIEQNIQYKQLSYEIPVPGRTVVGHWTMPEDAAMIYDNFTSKGLGGNKLFDAVKQAKGIATSLQLGVSAFHVPFVGTETMINQLTAAIRHARHGEYGEALKSAVTSPAAPFFDYKRGVEIEKAFKSNKPSGDAQIDAVVEAMQIGGYQWNSNKYEVQLLKRGADLWKTDNPLNRMKAVLNISAGVFELPTKFIMEKIVPQLKSGAFMRMAEIEMKRNPTMDRETQREVFGNIRQSMDNRMGQYAYDNDMQNRITRDLTSIALRSPGWTKGTIQEIFGGVVDWSKYLKARAKGEQSEFTYKMEYVVALPVMIGTMGAAINLLFTGEEPQDYRDYFFPRTGGIDENGHPNRISLASYMTQLFSAADKPIDTALNKLNPWIGALGHLKANKDFYGTKIYNEEDTFPEKLRDIIVGSAKEFAPFGVKGLQRQLELGETGVKAFGPMLGIMPAPSAMNRTPAEKQMAEYGAAQQKVEGRTKEDAAKYDAKRAIYRDYRKGDEGQAKATAQEAISSGTLTAEEVKNVEKGKGKSPLAAQFQHLDPEKALKVFELADDKERAELLPMFRKKIYGKMTSKTATQAAELRQRMRDMITQ